MYRYEKENWVRKVKDSYPKQWSTTYGDLNLNAGRHYVHDLGHDPHYEYDREPDSYYTDPDGYRHHHYEMTTRSTELRTARQRRRSVVDHTRRNSSDRDHQRRQQGADNDRTRRRSHSDRRDHQRRVSPTRADATRQNVDFEDFNGNENCTCYRQMCTCHTMASPRDMTSSRSNSRPRSRSVKVKLPPLHPSNHSTRLAAEIQHQFRRRSSSSKRRKPGLKEKFLGFKYLGQWKPNRTGLGYSIH